MDLKEFFNTDSHVSDLTVEIIASYCDEISVPKGERVIEQGVVCHHIYFLTQGIGRIVYEHNGEEETVAFGAEGNAFTYGFFLCRITVPVFFGDDGGFNFLSS